MRWFFSLPIFKGLRAGVSGSLTSGQGRAPQPRVQYVSRREMEQHRNTLAIMAWQFDTKMHDGRTYREWYDTFSHTEMMRMMIDGRDRTFKMMDGRKLKDWTHGECDTLIQKNLEIARLFGVPKWFQAEQHQQEKE